MKSSTKTFLIWLVPFALLSLLFLTTTKFNYLEQDTDQYIEFSNSILDGSLFIKKPVEDLPLGVLIRTPGYPLLLSLGRILFPDNLHRAVIASNYIIFLISFWGSYFLLRKKHTSIILPLAITAGDLFLQEYFPGITSEWMSFQLLTLFYALLIRFLETPNPKQLCGITFLVSCIILTRSALIAILAVPCLLLLYLPTSVRLRGTQALAIGIVPLLLWISFNGWRLNRFTLTPAGKQTSFHLALLLGTPTATEADSSRFKTFLNEIRIHRPPLQETDLEVSDTLSDAAFNIYKRYLASAFLVRERLNLPWIEFYDFMGRYSQLAWQQFFPTYLQHLNYSLHYFLNVFFIGMLLLFIRLRGASGAYIDGALLMCFAHLAVILSIILITPLNLRYYDLILTPTLIAVGTSCWIWSKTLLSKSDEHSSL